MTQHTISLKDDSNLAIQIGMQHNPVMNCYEVILAIGNIKTEDSAKDVAKFVHDLIWQEFDVSDAKMTKFN